ncbi:MAG: lysozyme inhibitor LprI family protein [Burkholderia sp.]
MKKIVYLALLLFPLSSFAQTGNCSGTVYDELACTRLSLSASKKALNVIYQQIYASTQYKNELEQSQKAWLAYRDKQCNGYIAAEAAEAQGEGAALITQDCLATLTRQRVEYLKTLVEQPR